MLVCDNERPDPNSFDPNSFFANNGLETPGEFVNSREALALGISAMGFGGGGGVSISKALSSGAVLPRTSSSFVRVGANKTEWMFGGFKSEAKWASQMEKRGWTSGQITQAIEKGKTYSAENLVNKGNSATRYVHPETGRSVVIDNKTKEIIHVGGDGFKY